MTTAYALASPPSPAISAVTHDSPAGALRIQARHDRIVRLDIEDDDRTLEPARLETSSPVLDEARRQLDAYFAGLRRRFDLPLDQIGTPFQEEIWKALVDVPWGEATTYGVLAERTGRPTGARAVGGAVRANRIALLVPCHRVLGAARRLTGYSAGAGVETKRFLLDLEGIDYVA